MKIGFIGQGFIGKSYADDLERRGHAVVRYALEEPYRKNKDKIQEKAAARYALRAERDKAALANEYAANPSKFLERGWR